MSKQADVTEFFSEYRLLIRDIWNRYFWSDRGLRSWDTVEYFDRLRPLLFESFLAKKIRVKIDEQENTSLRFIVVPDIPGPDEMVGSPIRISETEGPGSRWDQEPGWVARDDMELEFVDFFDWGRLNYWDLQFYLVQIAQAGKHPHLVGRMALIAVDHAVILIADERRRPEGGDLA